MHSGHGAPSIFPSPLSPAPVASLVLIVVLSYLLGAIPFSLVVGRMMGVDLRQHGSGNAGATNALRVLGKGPGLLVCGLFVCGGCFCKTPCEISCSMSG